MASFLNGILSKLRETLADKSVPPKDSDTLRKIAQGLEHLDPAQAKYLAAFAFILYRAAFADHDASAEEAAAIEEILTRWAGLEEAQAVLVAEIAKAQNRVFGGTDNFLVTREFKDIATPEQKTHLMECLFAVAASHRGISNAESDAIRVISKELRFEHGEFIAIRRQFADKLNALK